ncbi:helix-turn-helix transcriptional regulator [Acaryochloris marina]|uniref:helix-turn-helix domain-containing protein n=1 Tax=Acaryochloris marina TaxID=155978 RepID=UPI001BAF6B50|nr:helix-turn-helix domain-containing protein [Acaryochloris marina]QUY45779.1 helix-turn-helix domain-containing protein [Acaryochloris marina S15]
MAVIFKLKEVRENRGFSQNQLARATGMSPQNIQKIEQGKAKGIQFDTLEKICDALNCGITELLVRIKPEV